MRHVGLLTSVRRLVILSSPLILLASSAEGGPAVAPTVSQMCSLTAMPVADSASLSDAAPKTSWFSSPATGYDSLNCSHRYAVDFVNHVKYPPHVPEFKWSIDIEIDAVDVHSAKEKAPTLSQAECSKYRLDAEIWGQRSGGWTRLFDDHSTGKWYANASGGNCGPPESKFHGAFENQGMGYDRYRVVANAQMTVGATTSHVSVRANAAISQPEMSITKMELVAQTGGAPRPSKEIFYVGEPFKVNVVGNFKNNEVGEDVCFYAITMEQVTGGKNKTVITPNRFTIQQLPTPTSPGEYKIIAEANEKLPAPHCTGKVEKTVILHHVAPWITDVQLVGYGYRFPAGDAAGMPQFCSNCSSIFSPAHNTGFLRITPVIEFGDGKIGCHYSIDQKFDNDVRPGDAYYPAKGPVLPGGTYEIGTAGFTSTVKNSESPPFLNSWNNKNNHVTVDIHGNTTDPGYVACNIATASKHIIKTISFTDNEKLPPSRM